MSGTLVLILPLSGGGMDPPASPIVLHRCAVLASKALTNDFGVFVDQDGHVSRARLGLTHQRQHHPRNLHRRSIGEDEGCVVGVFPGRHALRSVRSVGGLIGRSKPHRLDQVTLHFLAIDILGADAASSHLADGSLCFAGNHLVDAGFERDLPGFGARGGPMDTSLRTGRFIELALASSAAKSGGPGVQNAMNESTSSALRSLA